MGNCRLQKLCTHTHTNAPSKNHKNISYSPVWQNMLNPKFPSGGDFEKKKANYVEVMYKYKLSYKADTPTVRFNMVGSATSTIVKYTPFDRYLFLLCHNQNTF